MKHLKLPVLVHNFRTKNIKQNRNCIYYLNKTIISGCNLRWHSKYLVSIFIVEFLFRWYLKIIMITELKSPKFNNIHSIQWNISENVRRIHTTTDANWFSLGVLWRFCVLFNSWCNAAGKDDSVDDIAYLFMLFCQFWKYHFLFELAAPSAIDTKKCEFENHQRVVGVCFYSTMFRTLIDLFYAFMCGMNEWMSEQLAKQCLAWAIQQRTTI